MKKKEIAKSACHIVNIQYKPDSKHNIEKTSAKRKFLCESPHELMKATSVKRLKMSLSPCSNIITRSKSKALVSPCSNKITCSKSKTVKLKFLQKCHKKTGNQVISADLKSEIRDNNVKYIVKQSNSPIRIKNEYPAGILWAPKRKANGFICPPRSENFSQDILTLVTKIEAALKGPGAKLEKTSYYNLLALNDVNLVQNAELFKCPLCFLNVDVGKGVTLQECLHSFCRICLADAILISQTAAVKCPFESVEYSCESYLQEKEIKSLVEPVIYQQYLQRSVALAESQAQNSFHCKTLNCPGWCFYEDPRNIFLCPVCHHFNCLFCAAIHEGKNCKEYQDDMKLRYYNIEEVPKAKQYLKDKLGKAMKCPQCQIILMKKKGCDWFRCSMCRTEICWSTKGPRWGPGGFGDTSGGSKCMVNVVRCHPHCKYCH